MGWPGTIVVGLLAGVAGALLAGYVANLAVGWYRVSSFEGGAGYFVVTMALLGAIGGLIIGLLLSRGLAAQQPGLLKVLGLALAATVAVIGAVGAVARLLADVPPRLDGEELFLVVELRWPAGRRPDTVPGQWFLRLSAGDGGMSRSGPLWLEDARTETGDWVVPGAVELFTEHGDRLLSVEPEGILDHGFVVPLSRRPGRKYLEWSPWLPQARPGDVPLPEGVRYRFRVAPRSQAIRMEPVGPFEVATIASGFWKEELGDGTATWAAGARFEISHSGQPVTFIPRAEESGTAALIALVDAVAVIPGPVPALLAAVAEDGVCHLVADTGGQLRVEPIAPCGDRIAPFPLTSDRAIFDRWRNRPPGVGRLDRDAPAGSSQLLFPGAVLDVATYHVLRFRPELQSRVIDRIPPLGLAPDGRSFVRLAFTDDPDAVALTVIIPGADTSYVVPVDRARTRYWDMDLIDPGWLQHYFAWEPAPPGPERLVPRRGVTPLPFRGRLTVERDYREYRIGPATGALRSALIAFLVSEFSAAEVSIEPGAFAHEVRVGTAPVHVSFRAEDAHVGVWMDRGTDTRLVATIAERFDEALRSGRYDHLFLGAP